MPISTPKYANIPFFKSIDFEYFAIEGSKTIVKQLHKRFPEIAKHIICEDFTVKIPFNIKFDLILDRSAITHNNLKSIKNTLSMIKESLNDQGFFIGIDWFSKNHSDSKKGIRVDDDFTRDQFLDGQFNNVGKVHFSDLEHLKNLLFDFEIIHLKEKIIKDFISNESYQFASWNFVARKKNG